MSVRVSILRRYRDGLDAYVTACGMRPKRLRIAPDVEMDAIAECRARLYPPSDPPSLADLDVALKARGVAIVVDASLPPGSMYFDAGVAA